MERGTWKIRGREGRKSQRGRQRKGWGKSPLLTKLTSVRGNLGAYSGETEGPLTLWLESPRRGQNREMPGFANPATDKSPSQNCPKWTFTFSKWVKKFSVEGESSFSEKQRELFGKHLHLHTLQGCWKSCLGTREEEVVLRCEKTNMALGSAPSHTKEAQSVA